MIDCHGVAILIFSDGDGIAHAVHPTSVVFPDIALSGFVGERLAGVANGLIHLAPLVDSILTDAVQKMVLGILFGVSRRRRRLEVVHQIREDSDCLMEFSVEIIGNIGIAA